jgi:predicted nucleic acid-binding protein
VIVVDTNVVVYLQVPGDRTREAEEVYGKDPQWMAPTLWQSEFRNALALYTRRGLVTLDEALDILQRAERLMQGQEFEVASASVLRMAAESGCSAYDCEYVWLAQDFGVPLVTADEGVLSKFKSTAVSMRAFCR